MMANGCTTGPSRQYESEMGPHAEYFSIDFYSGNVLHWLVT
jgi:hypothetical protein